MPLLITMEEGEGEKVIEIKKKEGRE